MNNKRNDMTGPYDDIIDLPHHVSVSHPQMPCSERAAQFSPFAALTGYEGAIEETARLTDDQKDLSENVRDSLDQVLVGIMSRPDPNTEVKITYFVPDAKKDGGKYVTELVRIRRIDTDTREIVTMDRRRIGIDMILNLGGEE